MLNDEQKKYFINKSQTQQKKIYLLLILQCTLQKLATNNCISHRSYNIIQQLKALIYIQSNLQINSAIKNQQMQNIQISHSKPKRSVESLIQDSAIDNEPSVINFQILDLKKAYNETYKSFNTKIQGLQSELDKYKQKCKKLQEANVSLAQKCYQLQKRKEQYNHMKICCEKMKRKVLYVQSKYDKLMENRALVQQGYENMVNAQQQGQGHSKLTGQNNSWSLINNSKVDKNQVYKEITGLLSGKIKQFTKQLRVHSMTRQLELKIETFLEQLIYITPISAGDGFKGIKERQIGKLSTKSEENILLSEQKAWKELSRNIDKLHQNAHDRSMTPKRRQNLFNQQHSRKVGNKTRSPLSANYSQNYFQDIEPQYRPSPKKTRIFTNN